MSGQHASAALGAMTAAMRDKTSRPASLSIFVGRDASGEGGARLTVGLDFGFAAEGGKPIRVNVDLADGDPLKREADKVVVRLLKPVLKGFWQPGIPGREFADFVERVCREPGGDHDLLHSNLPRKD